MEASFHPETAQLVEIFKQMGRVFDPNVTVEHQRKDTSAAIAMLNGMVSFEFSGTKFELFIPSSDSALPGGVPVDVIRPSNIQTKNPPILIYFHGGGMVVGDRTMTDITCKMLATQAQCIVVNVEYRLYPDNPAVAPFDDGVSVANWVLQNKQLIGGGALSAVGVGGDSAGGRLAASVAHDTSGLSFQILVYPHVSALGERFASYEKFKDAPLLNMELVAWFESQIKLSGIHPRSNSLGRPASSFSRLPPALIVLAEIDPIVDDGLEYAKKLAKYNIAHDTVTIKGTCHGFYTMPGLYKECSKQAYDATVAFIRKYGEEGKIIKPKANSRVCAIM